MQIKSKLARSSLALILLGASIALVQNVEARTASTPQRQGAMSCAITLGRTGWNWASEHLSFLSQERRHLSRSKDLLLTEMDTIRQTLAPELPIFRIQDGAPHSRQEWAPDSAPRWIAWILHHQALGATLDSRRWPLLVQLETPPPLQLNPLMELAIYVLPREKNQSLGQSLHIMFNSQSESVYDTGRSWRWIDKEALISQLPLWAEEFRQRFGVPLALKLRRLGTSSLTDEPEPRITRSGALSVELTGTDGDCARANLFLLYRLGQWIQNRALAGDLHFADALP